MKMYKYAISIILLFVFTSGLHSVQTAKEIIEIYKRSIGGEKALVAIQTLKMIRRFDHQDTGRINQTTVYYKQPNLLRWEAKDAIQVSITKGKKQWRAKRDSKGSPLKWGPEKPAYRKPAILDVFGRFLTPDTGTTLSYLGKVNDKGIDLYHIRKIPKKGPVKELFFDIKTGLLIKTMMGNKNSRRGIMTEYFFDYRPVTKDKKVLFPFKVKSKIESPDGKKREQINTVIFIKINTSFKDSLFMTSSKR